MKYFSIGLRLSIWLCLGPLRTLCWEEKRWKFHDLEHQICQDRLWPLSPALWSLVVPGQSRLQPGCFWGAGGPRAWDARGFLSAGTASPCHTWPPTVGQGECTAWFYVHEVNPCGWGGERQYFGVLNYLSTLSLNFITPSITSYTLTFTKSNLLFLCGLLM